MYGQFSAFITNAPRYADNNSNCLLCIDNRNLFQPVVGRPASDPLASAIASSLPQLTTPQ
jgi:hypothetical protein